MLGMFRNTLTANDKYPFRELEILLSPIQLQLSLKLKTFSEFFAPFPESTSNFKHFEKKKIFVIASLFRKLQTVKNFVRPLSKKHRFRTPVGSEYFKESQTFLKSA